MSSPPFAVRGYATHRSTLQQAPSKGQFNISLLDVEDTSIGSWSKDEYLAFQSYIGAAEDCKALWVTKSTSHTCSDPRFGFIHGLCRTLRTEILLDPPIIERPEWIMPGATALVQVYEKIQRT